MSFAFLQPALSYLSHLDVSVVYAVQSIGPKWEPVAWFLSNGLGYPVMLVISLAALFLIRKHRIAFELTAVSIASFAVVFILKLFLHATRPYLADPAVVAYATDSSYGLPSAHAVMSVVILGWIYLRHPKSHVVLWGSIGMVILIGLSRVYLGLHYPSQVLAGWAIGIILLFIYRVIDKRLWSPFQKKLK